MRTKKEKLKRFCEKCGAELIYVKLYDGTLDTCDWNGPVPYRRNEKGNALVVTATRSVLKSDLGVDPAVADGVGYVLHESMCAGESK